MHTDSTDSSDNVHINAEWSEEIENILYGYCKKCEEIVTKYSKKYNKYDRIDRYSTILITILQLINAILNIIYGRDDKNNIIFSILSITAIFINTMIDKLKFKERAIMSRNLSFDAACYVNKVNVELKLPVSQRKNCYTYLKYMTAEYNEVLKRTYLRE